MKKIWKLSIGLIVMVFAVACNKQDVNPGSENPPDGSNVVVTFDQKEVALKESEVAELLVLFNKPASKDGTLSIEVDNEFPNSFTSIPEVVDGLLEIDVNAGAENAKISIAPTNNDLLDGNKVINFKIKSVTDGFAIGDEKTLVLTITDDELPSEPQMVNANFAIASGSLIENVIEGMEVAITLSGPATASGKVVIHQTGSTNGLYYYTIPALDANSNITFDVEPGTTELKFKVVPINDEMLKSHQDVLFEIVDSEGSIGKGNQLLFSLKLLDKELIGKPKSYDSYGGGWRVKYNYFYNALGQVSLVEWENYTPNKRSGSYTYYYAENGLIERINHYPSRDEYFYQENGRIVKSEIVAHSDVVSYSFYDYDPAGNVGAKLTYAKNQFGEYVKELLYVYLYFDNGNIYKQLTYIPGEEEGAEELISTRTFDYYHLDKTNNFPMFEVIRGINSQPNLPTYHRVQEGNSDLHYQLSYEFDANGNAISRTVTGSSANEITYYEYY